jgi:phosphate transport system protein
MTGHLEASLQDDLEQIRTKIVEMGALAERALRASIEAVLHRDRQRAFAVILRDRYIDEAEKQLDRLCLRFLVRHQPAATLLRFAYGSIKINLELERVGDYAESVARQLLRLGSVPRPANGFLERIVQMADLAIPMIHDSIQAFVRQDPELAHHVIAVEPAVDALLGKLNAEIIDALRGQRLQPEMVEPLVTIGRRFERVADQARNVCMETIYMCTGEYTKHPGAETFRILFVGEQNACRSQMAEAIALSLNQPRFIFSSAGIDPRAIAPQTIEFIKEKGLDASRLAPKTIFQIPNLDHYQVIVGVAKEAQQAFPRSPRKTVYVDWSIEDPSRLAGSPEEVRAAYEATFEFLSSHVRDLVEAVLGIRLTPGTTGELS